MKKAGLLRLIRLTGNTLDGFDKSLTLLWAVGGRNGVGLPLDLEQQ